MDNTKILLWVILAIVAFQSGWLAQFGLAPAEGTTTDGKPLVDHITEDVTVTLSAVNAYQTGTKITTEYAKVYNNGFDEGLVSTNAGTFEADVNDKIRLYFFENSSTYYTQKKEITIKDEGQAKYQGDAMQIDTSPTLTFYNDDGDSNTAQSIGADTVKTVEIKYAATSKRAFGNPQCSSVGGVQEMTICFHYNTSAYTSVEMKDASGNKASSSAVPNKLAAYGNTSFGWSCYKAAGIKNSGEQRYKVDLTSGTPDPLGSQGNYVSVYYEDCDFDIDADNSAEIWGFEDEDNNDLGSTTLTRDLITVS